MWVQSEFVDDEDDRLMWLQHDCYWNTLRLIHSQIQDTSGVILPPKIDHRDFQRAHDLLAACFRHEFKAKIGYKKLCVDNILGKTIETIQPKHDQEVIGEWVNWLKKTLLITEIANSYKSALQGYVYQTHSTEIIELENAILSKFHQVPWLDVAKPKLMGGKKVGTIMRKGVKAISADEKVKIELSVLKKQKQIIAKSISQLQKQGIYDQGFHLEINWPVGAFRVSKTGWSKVTKFEYEYRKEQLLPKLPEGGGCVYVLGINGRPDLCKIGFTTLSAHQRANHYGRKHEIDLFVCEIHDSPDARALEKVMHDEFSDHRYEIGKATEVFSITPADAGEKLRAYLPKVSKQARQRELQWLLLEKLLTDSKILKLSVKAG